MPDTPVSYATEQNFSRLLEQHQLSDKLFIAAISGGIDSMVLANLLLRSKVKFVIAHCNFHLRNEESNDDERFVASWAKSHAIPYHVQNFDTKSILDEEGGNLQDTARKLRYNWFEQLRKELKADLVATAHHANDSAETLLMNIFKGTGIKGLHGILFRQGNIIRPLISFERKHLAAYASENNITWREDSSNKKEDYTRNNIRHNLIPLAERIFPNVIENLQKNTRRFSEAEILYRQAIDGYRKKLVEKRKEDFYIPVLKLRHVQPVHTIVYELLKDFGFQPSQTEQIIGLMKAETGRYIQSPSHRVIRNRDFLVITPLRGEDTGLVLLEEADILGGKEIITRDFKLHCSFQQFNGDLESVKSGKDIAFADIKHLEFPLLLRRWKNGDYFYPLGMRKKKKVARFLIDQKIPLHEKEKIWVIESNKRILWVVGERPDDRFRISPSTRTMLKISVTAL